MRTVGLALLISAALVGNVYASDNKHQAPKEDNKCIGAGSQAPRNIDSQAGSNSVILKVAPAAKDMNLCNIHFHRNAEYKSAAFSTFVEDGDHSGWACQEPAPGRLSHKHAEHNGCQGIAEGDTIEVHWVHITCDIETEGVRELVTSEALLSKISK